MIKSKILSPIDQWLGINREIKLYKVAILFLGLLVLTQLLISLTSQNKAPIVIHTQGEQREYHIGKRELNGLTQDDVRAFLREFIKTRYNLNGDDLSLTLKNIVPFSTDGYLAALSREMERDFSSSQGQIKSFEQYVSRIEVIVSDDQALARFDKIIRLNGLPLVVPTEASFQIVKAKATRWNPYAILVNGVTEHESK